MSTGKSEGHTPGPWATNGVTVGTTKPASPLWAKQVATVRTSDAPLTQEDHANARLIAAAPDMLEAARPFDLFDWLTSGVLDSPRSDGLEVKLSIEGTTYEAIVTVGQLRALSAAIARASGHS